MMSEIMLEDTTDICEEIQLNESSSNMLMAYFKITGLPGGLVVKNPPANAGDRGSTPGLGRCHMPWSS